MKPRIVVVLGLFLFLCCAVFSQEPLQAAASREEVIKMLDALHTKDMMKTMMTQMGAQAKAMARRNFPKVSPEQLAEMDRMMDESFRDLPMDEMLDNMIPIYQKHFTKQDIVSMVAFYNSATGQKMLREMPAMMQESMQANMAVMEKRMEATQKRIEQRMKELEGSSKPATGHAPKPANDNSPKSDKN